MLSTSQEYILSALKDKLGTKYEQVSSVVNELSDFLSNYSNEVSTAELSPAAALDLDKLLETLWDFIETYGGAEISNAAIREVYYDMTDAYRNLSRLQRIHNSNKSLTTPTYKIVRRKNGESLEQFAQRVYNDPGLVSILYEDNPDLFNITESTNDYNAVILWDLKVRVSSKKNEQAKFDAWDLDSPTFIQDGSNTLRGLKSVSDLEAIKRFVKRVISYSTMSIMEFPWLGIVPGTLIGSTVLDYDSSEVRSQLVSSLMQLGFFDSVSVESVTFDQDAVIIPISLNLSNYDSIEETYTVNLSAIRNNYAKLEG